jgi:hypothetical protein
MGSEALVRIQFEMVTERAGDLDRLMKATGIRTRRELFDNALTLFEWAVAVSERGHLVTAHDEETGKFQPILMPALETARRTGSRRTGRAGRTRAADQPHAKRRG